MPWLGDMGVTAASIGRLTPIQLDACWAYADMDKRIADQADTE